MSAQYVLDAAREEIQASFETPLEGPLYEVVIFENRHVELVYRFSEEGNDPKYWPFFDRVRKMFDDQFGPGRYQEHYDQSFIVEVPVDQLEATKQLVEAIAERAGEPHA